MARVNLTLAVISPAPYNSHMGKFDDLEKQVRALSRKEKAALARVLIDELDPISDPAVEELWLEEARRRYDAYRQGDMQSIPGDEAMVRARSRLR
jgi:Putative addiction module component